MTTRSGPRPPILRAPPPPAVATTTLGVATPRRAVPGRDATTPAAAARTPHTRLSDPEAHAVARHARGAPPAQCLELRFDDRAKLARVPGACERGAARRRRPAGQNECGAHTRAVLPPLEAHAPHVGEEDNSRTLAPPPPQDNETRERATRAASERARRACVRTRHRALADLTQREEREVEPRVGRDPRAPRAERAADRALDAESVARPRGRQQHLKLGREQRDDELGLARERLERPAVE